MILPISDLKLLSFEVVESSVAHTPPRTKELPIDKYQIDVDFEVRIAKDNVIIVFTTVNINANQTQFCHKIKVDAISVFELGTSKPASREILDTYIKDSAIGIAFNNLRGYIRAITAYSPIGMYNLPLFSVASLIDEKYKDILNPAEPPIKKVSRKKTAGKQRGSHKQK